VLAIDDVDQRLDRRPGLELAAAVAVRLSSGFRLPIIECRTSDAGPTDLLDGAVDNVVTADDGDLARLLLDVTAPGDIVVKGLATTGLGLDTRFVRLARNLNDRTVIAASPPRADRAERTVL
jgi:hypothetical protein